MAQDLELNSRIKEMWRLDEKEQNCEEFTIDESLYYSEHLREIVSYYERNGNYWISKLIKHQRQ